MNMFPFNFEFSEKEYPSLYEEGEHPSELLQSINNKLDKQDEIIAELKENNSKLQKQSDFNEQEAKSAKKHSLLAYTISIISIAIALIDLINNLFR